MTTDDRPREGYSLGYSEPALRELLRRGVDEFAGFFLPYLQPGMRLLDVGSGPGTITLGLANVVAPGEVVGIDIDPAQVERARALAAEHQVANVRFETGDAYALPFPDASFDAVFANTVLFHLRDPLAALKEFRRVLRSGGVAGVNDLTDILFSNSPSPLLAKQEEMWRRSADLARGRPASVLDFQQRRLLREAGFARTEAYAEAKSYGTPDAVRRQRNLMADRADQIMRPRAFEQGWADAATMDAIVAEMRASVEDPDTFFGAV
jgi:ubiquinone/menaquinone biosynthesis C-methylase UbiE